MKKILKSLLVMAIVAGSVGGATGAYFTSTVSANNNQIVVGTLRLAIDSSRTHTYAPHVWNPFDSYTVVQDVNGVSTNYNTLEPWLNAAPGPAAPFAHVTPEQTFPEGNHSYWISLRNAGSIPMIVKANLGSGTWAVDPAVQAANETCTNTHLNEASVLSVPNVTIYTTDGMANICKSQQECENIYYGLTSLPGWHYATDPAVQVAGNYNIIPSSTTVHLSPTGAGSAPIVLNQNEFVIARVDLNFNTSDNCFQGATYTYNLTGNAYQVGDVTTWATTP